MNFFVPARFLLLPPPLYVLYNLFSMSVSVHIYIYIYIYIYTDISIFPIERERERGEENSSWYKKVHLKFSEERYSSKIQGNIPFTF